MKTCRPAHRTRTIACLTMSAAVTGIGCGGQPFDQAEPGTSSRPTPVVGGEPASALDYPSTVALTDPSGEPFCTGTLVSSTLVVTAAHCLQDWWGNPISSGEVRIVYGYETPSTAPSSARRPVASVHPHPQYQPDVSTDADGMGHTNDIGAVVLQEPIAGGVVAPVLPAGAVDTELTPGREVHIVGYGIYNYNQQKAGKLYKAITPHIRHIQWEMLAGQPGEPDTCNGDSGGPAYLVVNGALFLTGITSRAWAKSTHPCGDGGIYTIASQYVDWLESVGGELDGGVTEGGFEGGGWDASPDAKPLLDASAACLPLTSACHPVTNEGCDASKGEACRLNADGTTSCHVGTNDQPAGALCDETSRFCEVGYHCGGAIRCEQYCCGDSDCTAGGTCTPLFASIGSLGTCGVPPQPEAGVDAGSTPDAAPDVGPEASMQDASSDAGELDGALADVEADGGQQDYDAAGPVADKRVVEGAGCGCGVVSGGAAVSAWAWVVLVAGLVTLRRRR